MYALSEFFFYKIVWRGETKFSRNEGVQAKIHKIYVVHTLGACTCTSFCLSACLSQTGLAPVLISFNFFFNILLHVCR